jgi:hypothetical protein
MVGGTDAGYPAGPACQGEDGERAVRLDAEGMREVAAGVAQPLLRATRRLQLTGTTALRRTKGWGAVLAALVSGLVLRSLCYTVTALRSAVTAAV